MNKKGHFNPFDDNEVGMSPNGLQSSHWRDEYSTGSNSNSAQTQILDSKSRIKASQQRALSSILNSEEIGVATAQELIEQGEKLDRAEQRLNDIENLQKDSQKKINTLSSVFGGLKNIFSRRQSQPVQPVSTPVSREAPQSRSTLKQSCQVDSNLNQQLQTTVFDSSSNQALTDNEFNRNLSLMSDGMSRLKNLAQGLNDELRTQNSQLDRMAPRIDRVTDTITNQNRQMNNLLGIKPK